MSPVSLNGHAPRVIISHKTPNKKIFWNRSQQLRWAVQAHWTSCNVTVFWINYLLGLHRSLDYKIGSVLNDWHDMLLSIQSSLCQFIPTKSHNVNYVLWYLSWISSVTCGLHLCFFCLWWCFTSHVNMLGHFLCSCADPEEGGGDRGSRPPPPPWKITKLKGFLAKLVRIPCKTTKLPSQP